MLSLLFPLVNKQDLILQFLLKNITIGIVAITIFLVIYRKWFKYSLLIVSVYTLVYLLIGFWITYKIFFIKYDFSWYEFGAIWLGTYWISTLLLIIFVPIFLIELLTLLIRKQIRLSDKSPKEKYSLVLSAILFLYLMLSIVYYLLWK